MPRTKLMMTNKSQQSGAPITLQRDPNHAIGAILREAPKISQRKAQRKTVTRLDKLSDQMTNLGSHVDDVSADQRKTSDKLDNVNSNVTESASYNLNAILPQINKLASSGKLLQTDVENLNANTERLINMKRYEMCGIGAGFALIVAMLIF